MARNSKTKTAAGSLPAETLESIKYLGRLVRYPDYSIEGICIDIIFAGERPSIGQILNSFKITPEDKAFRSLAKKYDFNRYVILSYTPELSGRFRIAKAKTIVIPERQFTNGRALWL